MLNSNTMISAQQYAIAQQPHTLSTQPNAKNATMRKAVKATSLLAALVFLTGCAFAPGSHMDRGKAGEELNGRVEFHQITPELVANIRAPRTQARQNPDLDQASQGYDYQVGRGDVLTITVWNHPELTIPAGSMRNPAEAGNWVHNDGTIFYPYIGRVHVDGMRLTEIQEVLTRRLGEYIESPQVEVNVAAFRSKRVYVTGEVQQPGMVPITNIPTTLLDAINSSGGITEEADWGNVVLTRNGEETRFSFKDLYQRGDTTQNTLLQHGDIVHVERNDINKVFVLGEVRNAQSVPMNRVRMSLAEGLSEAGGIDEQRADARGVFVFREAPEGAEHLVDVYQLNIQQATSYILADQFELQPRDVVFVTAAPVARWNRVISLIMPTVTGLYQISRTDNELSGR